MVLKKIIKDKFLILLVFLFMIDLLLVLLGVTKVIDKYIHELFINLNFLDAYFKFITKFGNPEGIFIVLLVLFIIFRKKDFIFLTFFGAGINYFLKNLIRRDRPLELALIEQGGFSFPSGHSMISIVLYGYLLYFLNKKIQNNILRKIVIIFLLILIISIMISRVYLGVHYFSDIIGGFLLGLIIIYTYINYWGWYNEKNDSK